MNLVRKQSSKYGSVKGLQEIPEILYIYGRNSMTEEMKFFMYFIGILFRIQKQENRRSAWRVGKRRNYSKIYTTIIGFTIRNELKMHIWTLIV